MSNYYYSWYNKCIDFVLRENHRERESLFCSVTTRVIRYRLGGKHRGLFKIVSRTSFIPDLCSWQFQEPNNINFEQVKLLENKLPTILGTLAVVMKEETLEEEEIGGWGLKFLKKSQMVKPKTNDASETKTSTSLTSMNVVIPSGNGSWRA